MNKGKKFSERYLPAILWLVLLLALILSPGDKLPSAAKIPGLDKVAHFSLFAGLLLLWNRALNSRDKKFTKQIFITNYLVFGIIFAILVEVIQQMVPNRAFDLLDIVANLSGSFVGTVCFYILYKKKSKLV
ncbi:VanZ family protein [Echinicola sp. 20G]|uniref:VanZ family protein n=1 Tax=Echinicola sp. 20G TaxID=2781961 RepID=UPI001F47CD51|nr:VanZ family protein [Echinicola sp. 20G]